MPSYRRRWTRAGPQSLAVTDQLIKIHCASMDLGDRPVTNGSVQSWHINLEEEIAEWGIRLRTRQLDLQCLSERGVVVEVLAKSSPSGVAFQ